jgi:hypothetical protein
MGKLFGAVFAGALVGLAALPASALVVNGSFEDMTGVGTPMNGWGVYSGIPGWTTFTGAGIEVQRGNVGGSKAHDGEAKVELDSHNNSGMSQKLMLTKGRYELTFAYKPRVNGNPDATNTIGYAVLGGGLSGTVSRGDGIWSIVTGTFLSNGKELDLRFWADGKSDTLGGYIDSVSVAPVPLPASAAMLGGAVALAGLAAARRKHRNQVRIAGLARKEGRPRATVNR